MCIRKRKVVENWQEIVPGGPIMRLINAVSRRSHAQRLASWRDLKSVAVSCNDGRVRESMQLNMHAHFDARLASHGRRLIVPSMDARYGSRRSHRRFAS